MDKAEYNKFHRLIYQLRAHSSFVLCQFSTMVVIEYYYTTLSITMLSQEKIELAHQRKKDVEEKIKAMAGDTDTLEPQRAELKKEYIEKKQVMRTHADSLKQVQHELVRQEKDRKDMRDRINDLQARCVALVI